MKKISLPILLFTSLSILTGCNTKNISDEYFVYWINDDGSLIDKDVVKSGEHPTHDVPTAKKTTKIGYHYEFVDWINQYGELYSNDFIMPKENIIFTSIYTEKINSYTVTWKDSDGSVIDTTTVEYEGHPTHENAKKDPDEEKQEEYYFNGWYIGNEQINLSEYEVTEDVTMTAKYDAYNKGGCNYNLNNDHESYSVGSIQTNYPLNKITILDEFKGKPVTKIPDSVFRGSPSKDYDFVIGDNIETIEPDAFFGVSIESITFGTNSHLKTICDSAFFEATTLHTFIAPSSLEKVGDLAFAYVEITLFDLTNVDHIVTLVGNPFHGQQIHNLKIKVTQELLEEYKTTYTKFSSYFFCD